MLQKWKGSLTFLMALLGMTQIEVMNLFLDGVIKGNLYASDILNSPD